MKPLPLLCVLLGLLALPAAARADDSAAATLDVGQPPHLRVPRIPGPLVIDGDLSKPEWQQAAVIPDLLEDTPTPGAPNPYHTEVRLLRDADHLYVAIHAIDPDPEHIQLNTLARDANQDSDDHISIVLDTFRDHRYAYVFRINSGGARQDGLISVGSTSPDFSWDGIWDVKSKRTAVGWDLEIAFDTRSFQFDPGSDQWGFNVLRYMRRNDYGLVWFARPMAGSVFDLKHEGVIEGMAGLEQGKGWQVSPYVLARSDQINPGSKRFETGGEVKYNLTPQLSATLTVNTDFAQTEADSEQINLTQFPLFFPEKRAFFLDGQSLFAFNGGPQNGDLNGGFIPYYSRTVGLSSTGLTVPIDDGLKAIGRVGNLSLGVLDVNTGSLPGVPSANLGVARFAYNATDHWQFGTLFTRGNPDGSGQGSLAGFDTAWQTATFLGDQNLGATAWGANTSGAAVPGQTKGWGFDVNYPNVYWSWEAQLNVFGDAFDPALGFLPRPGTRQYYESVSWYPRPATGDNPWLENYVFGESYDQISGLDGHTQSSKLIVTPAGSYGFNGNYLNLHLTREYESLSAPFQVDPNVAIPVGNYTFDGYRLEWDTPTASKTTWTFILTGGQFYGGHALNDAAQFNWYALDGKLSMLLYYQAVFAQLPQGHFVQRLWQFNGTYSFTPDFSISSFVQYDTRADQLGFNTRLHWVIADDKDLYVVWNRNWRQSVTDLTPGVPDVADTVIVKLAWNFKE